MVDSSGLNAPKDIGFEIPRDVKNITHDFRVAVFSFLDDFKNISNFNYDSANIVINPEGVTGLTFSCSTAPSAVQGQFILVGGLVGQPEKIQGTRATVKAVILDENGKPLAQISDKISSNPFDAGSVETRGMDLGSMYSNSNQIIKPMDYVAIFTKDVWTNRWYGSTAEDNSVPPPDAKPKFIGLISSILVDYNAQTNQMMFTIQFKTMLRLLELARFSSTRAQFDTLSQISGKDFNNLYNNVVLEAASFGSQIPANEIITALVTPDYPSQLITDRIEKDTGRGEPQSISFQAFSPQTLQGAGNYETKLSKIATYAVNKDMEFYAAEDGHLVWKIPTYARGINRQPGNRVTTLQFNPDNYALDNRDTVYHIHEFISMTLQQSETEIVNVVNGALDFDVNGLGSVDQNQLFSANRYIYFIEGGDATSNQYIADRRFGFRDVGIRPIQLRNPLYYENVGATSDFKADLPHAQMMYYDMKALKNNIGKYWTASLTMIDDPRIQCGFPIIVPLTARAGVGSNEGHVLPAIFYITATSRKYEYNKPPFLTLTLTHGRFIDEEFHNGIHIFNHLSSWWGRFEPTLFWELGSLFDAYPTGTVLNKQVIDYTPNDARIENIIQRNILNTSSSNRIEIPDE